MRLVARWDRGREDSGSEDPAVRSPGESSQVHQRNADGDAPRTPPQGLSLSLESRVAGEPWPSSWPATALWQGRPHPKALSGATAATVSWLSRCSSTPEPPTTVGNGQMPPCQTTGFSGVSQRAEPVRSSVVPDSETVLGGALEAPGTAPGCHLPPLAGPADKHAAGRSRPCLQSHC